MHLAAVTKPTATWWLRKLLSRVDRSSLRYSCSESTANLLVNRRTSIGPGRSIFPSRVANFLERGHSKFHYSVIDGGATYSAVGRSICAHSSNDEVLIVNSDTSASAAAVRGDDI